MSRRADNYKFASSWFRLHHYTFITAIQSNSRGFRRQYDEVPALSSYTDRSWFCPEPSRILVFCGTIARNIPTSVIGIGSCLFFFRCVVVRYSRWWNISCATFRISESRTSLRVWCSSSSHGTRLDQPTTICQVWQWLVEPSRDHDQAQYKTNGRRQKTQKQGRQRVTVTDSCQASHGRISRPWIDLQNWVGGHAQCATWG